MAKRSGGSKAGRGIKGGIISLFWLIVACALVVAFFKVNQVQDSGQFVSYLRIKSNEVKACVNKSTEAGSIQCSLNLRIGNYLEPQQYPQFAEENEITVDELKRILQSNPRDIPIEDPQQNETEESQPEVDISQNGLKVLPATKMSPQDALNRLDSLKVVNNYKEVNYSRGNWKHWKSVDDRKCWNAREEALYQQAEKDSVSFLDKNKKPIGYSNACSIESGKWIDPLSKEEFNKPGYLDVDHIVPLALAARSGAYSWTPEQKAKYANDTDVLIVTSAKQNRSKGAKSPSEWMPPNKDSHCDYAKIYINVLYKYKLNITQDDKEVLNKAIGSCVL